jgi:cytochrome b
MASQPFDQDVWKRRVSNNCAGALVVFALLHILCVAAASGHAAVSHMIALVVPVAGAIPLMARFEAHWLARRDASGFRGAAALLWVAAVVVPFLWSGLYRLIG